MSHPFIPGYFVNLRTKDMITKGITSSLENLSARELSSLSEVYKGLGYASGGRYRRKQWKSFDTKAYHQRVKLETVHSVEKQKMGDIVLQGCLLAAQEIQFSGLSCTTSQGWNQYYYCSLRISTQYGMHNHYL